MTDEQINLLWDSHKKEWPEIGKTLISPVIFARTIEAAVREELAKQVPVANVFSCRYIAELRIYSSQVHSYLPLASGDSLYAAPVVPADMAKLRNIASIAHCGGLVGMSVSDALTAVRRATLPYFDTEATEEQHRAMIAAAQEEA